jgi:deoxyribonuclease-4
LGATAIQIFTGRPQQWAPRPLAATEAAEFRAALSLTEIGVVASHDSYLINLATPDAALFDRSLRAFQAELERCERLAIDFLVTHPGNATSGDRSAALARNASAIVRALAEVPGDTVVLLETTAGSGTALGWRFEELAEILAQLSGWSDRIGVCLDTAHVFAAGYDLRGEYDAVMREFDAIIGLDRLGLLHLNDSKAPLGSRVDRHEQIGRGELGEAPFAALMSDMRLERIPRVIETPKGTDPVAADRQNLDLLRRLATR